MQVLRSKLEFLKREAQRIAKGDFVKDQSYNLAKMYAGNTVWLANKLIEYTLEQKHRSINLGITNLKTILEIETIIKSATTPREASRIIYCDIIRPLLERIENQKPSENPVPIFPRAFTNQESS